MDGMYLQVSPDEPQRLTDWKQEPTLQSLKADLEAAKPSQQEHIAKVEAWQNLAKIQGSARPPRVPGRSQVQPKLVRRQAEWRYSALTEPFLGLKKMFTVNPSTFEDGEAARQNELVLNYQFRHVIDPVRFIDNFVRATVDEGTCIVRIGWERVTVMVDTQVPVWSLYEITDESQLETLKAALELKTSNPRGYDEQVPPEVKVAVDHYLETQKAVYAEQTGTTTQKVEKVLENRPTIEVMDIRNVYIDPSANGDPNKAMFVIVSFETSYAELKKKPNYKNLDKVLWNSSSPGTDGTHTSRTPTDFQFQDKARIRVVAYEYWGFADVTGDGTLTPFVATWIGNVLVRMELNPFPDGKLPFVIVPYLPIKRELYGEADAELLEDNQKILGALMRGLIDLLAGSANGQRGTAKGMLDAVNRRRFDQGLDYEFNPNVHPTNGYVEHKYPEIPQSALVLLQMINQDAESLTGVKSFAEGISGEAYGQVAAGIRGILSAAGKREMAILRRLANGMVQIGVKIAAMNAVLLSEQETIRITNTEFVTIKREDLAGNFDLEVDIATIEVNNAKAQDLAFILQTIGPNAPLEVTTRIIGEIAELKNMPVLAHWIKTFRPTPTPEQQQMAQLEIQKLSKEVEKLDSEIQLNLARAQRERSQSDLNDLDFVEQETGTKHARDMQKQQAQARGNQHLQVTKALTTPRKEGEKEPDIEAAVGFNELSEQLAVDQTGTRPLFSGSGL